MIALRGHLKQQDDKKWKWQGLWAFGALPDATPKSAKNPSVRPFNYTWIEPESANKVFVPSLLGMGDDEDEDEDDDNTAASVTVPPTDNVPASAVKANYDSMIVIPPVSAVKLEKSTALPSSPTVEKAQTKTLQPADELEHEAPPSTPPFHAKDQPLAPPDDSKPSESTPATDLERMPPPKPRGITFATTSAREPNYTEGHTVHPDTIPPDGNWTGYFENASTRKDRHSSRVSEHFAIFFNATPAMDARMLFLDEEEEDVEEDDTAEAEKKADADASEDMSAQKKKEGNTTVAKSPGEATPKRDPNVGMLPAGFVHVRGMGTNQFGTFELLGALDLATGVLECQRMYVVTPDNTKLITSRKKQMTTRHRTPDGVARPYSTRKRQLSWQRRSSMSDDEDEMVGLKRFSATKKRPRTVSDAHKSPLPGASTTTPRPPVLLIPGMPDIVKRPSPIASSAPVPVVTKKRAPAAAKPNPSTGATGTKVPLVGDPNQARWRAAHFLYYQRNDPSAEENGGTGIGATTRFVVYEGEMLNGGCQRDGRGVCLFNNGMLYEGEWKRNKEHGKGTLMTADRRRILYEGEWERGRMHGQGTYYYNDEASAQARRNSQIDSRYTGEFKENARHGVGKYFLPDGSTYEGEWRDNYMSGQGTFCWPDGSIYIGQWKDGKRHGTGALTSSDGFTYDGMWVQNSMEGRGIAGYPSGQRYEGLWANGRREGRGTIVFTNGAVYEGRFRDDCMEGQGTMKMSQNVIVPARAASDDEEAGPDDWMIPISFQSDIGHIHQKAGFTVGGE